MKIVVAYKWTSDPEEATVGADGTVDWSRARPGISTNDPVAIELARGLAEATGAELIGVTVGAKGDGTPLAPPSPAAWTGSSSSRMTRSRTPGRPSWARWSPGRSVTSATWTWS